MSVPAAESPRAASSGPRRLSGPDAAATLWCGHAIDALAFDAPLRRAVTPLRPPGSATLAELEGALQALAMAPVLLDGSFAARALAGLRRGDAARAPDVVVRFGTAAATTSASGPTLDAEALDVGALFDAHVAAGAPPTVDGFEARVLEALAERAGLSSAISARGGDALFAAGDDARRACRRPRPRFLRRRFRAVADPLDVAGARTAEIAGLEGAPIHRVSAIAAVLPTQARDALARFGPRAVPRDLPKDGHLPALWAATASLGLERVAADARRVRRPFADPDVRALVEALPRGVRFGRPGSGGPLGGWARGLASAAGASFDAYLDRAVRGPLAPRVEHAFGVAAAQPAFEASGVTAALVRVRAGSHGWSGRRALTVAFLALHLAREGLTLDDA